MTTKNRRMNIAINISIRQQKGKLNLYSSRICCKIAVQVCEGMNKGENDTNLYFIIFAANVQTQLLQIPDFISHFQILFLNQIL